MGTCRRTISLSLLIPAAMIAGCQTTQTVQSNAVNCYDCHNPVQLSMTVSNEASGIREWMQTGGAGLVMVPAYNPPPLFLYELEWPQRGRHDFDLNTDDCAQCHPVYNGVENHSNSEYPAQAQRLLYMGGVNCASACHPWLEGVVRSAGFSSNAGTTPTYYGTLDPYTLLTSVKTAHTDIFLSGFRITQDDADLDMRFLDAGCGGCHNWDGPRHGHVAECTDCHVFDPSIAGGLHQSHIDTIGATQSEIDPADSGMPACAYCHGFSDTTVDHTLSNASCYNCHLSGHQPMGPDGMPQFWDANVK
ncbi:MAG: hypothetical protein M1517_05755 [Deltaproteobacteria bacterium]|nr:hypothetical protein [Deltaproteobacteria bacterium]